MRKVAHPQGYTVVFSEEETDRLKKILQEAPDGEVVEVPDTPGEKEGA